MPGMLRNKTFETNDTKLLKILYLTFVRQLIEFAVSVWSPYLKTDIEKIEPIQYCAVRKVKKLRNLS